MARIDRDPWARAHQALALEPRIMFDAAGAATYVDANDAADRQDGASYADGDHAGATGEAGSAPTDVVFIDPSVSDAEVLAANAAGAEVILLGADRPALEQIAEHLNGYSGLRTIHIVSHGAAGELHFASGTVGLADLEAFRAELAAIGSALTADGDILLYGCYVAADGAGGAFIGAFASLTDADVAASDDPTGAAALDGDWTLEAQTGPIAESGVTDAFALSGYAHVLAPADLNFDTETPRVLTSGVNIGGLTFSISGTPNSHMSVQWVAANFIITPNPSDLAVLFNFGANQLSIDTGPVTATIADAAGNPFRIVSMEVDTGAGLGTQSTFTIQGYNNNVLVVADTVDTSVSDGAGSVSYTKVGPAAGRGGTLTFDGTWATIDEIRLIGTDIVFAVDQFDFEASNIAPTVDLNTGTGGTGHAASFVESANQGTGPADGVLITNAPDITDPEADTITQIVVNLTNSQGDTGERVFLSGTFANVNYTLDSATQITITNAGGATQAQMEAALAAVRYQNNSDTPNTTTRTIDVQVSDAGGSTTSQATVSITASNDDPTGSGVPALFTFTEDTPGALDLTGVTIGDVDSGVLAITVTISVTSGRLSVPGFPSVPGTGTGSLTLTGDVASVQGNLATPNFFLYTPAANVAGTNAATLTVTIRDNGNTGLGGGGTITIGTGQIDITPVNDAPTLTGGGTLAAVNEDTTSPPGAALNTLGITAADVDGTVVGYAIVGNTANATTQGAWQYSTNGGTNWFSVGAVADGATALALDPATLVRFVPVANFNGAPPALTIRAIDSTYGGGFSTTAGAETRVSVDTTTNGGATAISAATATIATSITAVNDDPTGSGVPALFTFTEDTPGALDLTGVTIGDVDSGVLAITVTISVTSGRLSVPGFPSVPGTGTGSLTLTGDVASVQGNLATPNFFLYTPDANVAGTNAATLTVTIRDNGNTGLGGGGTITIGTGQIDITPVNDAPTVTTTGGSAAYTENAAGVPVDPGLTLADIDNATLASATVSITGGFQAGADVLAFVNDGATMGNVTASYAAGTGVLTLISAGATATLAEWTAALRAVTYANTSEDPSTAARTVSVVVNDGGASSTAATRGVTVTAVNDAPTNNPAFGFVNTGASTETAGLVTITNAMLNEGDPDDSGAGVTYTVTTTTANGTLFLDLNSDNVVDTFEERINGLGFTQAQLDNGLIKYLHGGGGGSSDSFVFSVADGGENGSTPLTGQTFTITIAARPVLAINGGAPAHVEDAGATTVAPNLTLSDADSANLTGATVTITDRVVGDVLGFTDQNGITGSYNAGTGVLTLTGTATLANYQAALRSITYSTTNDNPATGAGNADRVISFTVTDGTLNSTAQAQTVGVTNANDAPTLDATQSPALTGIAEDLGAPTNGSTANSTLVSALLGGMADVDTGALQGIAIVGTGAQGTLWYSIDGGTTWTQVPAVSAGAALLLQSDARLYYQPAANATGTVADVLTFRGWDRTSGTNGGTADTTTNGGGTAFSTATDTDTVSVAVSNVNDAPVLDAGTGTTTFSGGAGSPKTPVAVAPGLTLQDIDVGEGFATALVQITGGYVNGQDVLAFTANAALFGNITASFDAGTGTLTLTSAGGTATLAQMEAALRSVTYANTSDTPNTADRTISIRVNDGDANSNVVTRTVVVETINDPPTITAPAALAVTEDVATALTGISFADPDAGGATVTVTLSAPAGTFLAVTSGGVGVVGAGTGTLTLTGSIANINLFIANGLVSYATAANAQGAVALTVAIDDGGNSGTGGPQTAQAAVTLDITAVNDAPDLTVPAAIAVTEDVATALTGIVIADVDAGAAAVTATLSAPSGTFAAASGAGVTVGGTPTALTLTGSVADINAFVAASGVTFTTAANATAPVVLTVTVNDGGNTGVGGALADTETVTLTVTAVDDAPTLGGLALGQAVTDKTTIAPFAAATIADVDSAAVTVTVTLDAAAKGSFTTLAGFTDAGGGVYTFTGAPAAAQAALRALVFTPAENRVAPGATETTTFAVRVADATTPTQGAASVVATSVNDAPALGGLVAGVTALDSGTVAPFAAATVADPDSGQPLTVTVTLDDAAKGAFTAASLAATGFASAGGGVYTLSAPDAAAAQAALRGLVFAPAANRVAPGLTETTAFTVAVSDGAAPAAVDATASVVATSVNDAPTAVVTIPAQAVEAGRPFSLVLPAAPFADVDVGDAVTVTVEGLPAGLSYDAASRTISGTAPTQGVTAFSVVGTDAAGARTTIVVGFTAGAPPIVTETGPPPPPPVPDLPPPPVQIVPAPQHPAFVPDPPPLAEDFGGVGGGVPVAAPDPIVGPAPIGGPVLPRPSFFLSTPDAGVVPGFGIRADTPIGGIAARAGGGPISFALPTSTFVVENSGVRVLVGATLADGSPLPAWVEFDPATGTFRIDAPPGFTGELNVVVSAALPSGESASSELRITIEEQEGTGTAPEERDGAEPGDPQRETAVPVDPAIRTAEADAVPLGKPAFSEVVKAASRGAWATQGDDFLDNLIAVLPAARPSGETVMARETAGKPPDGVVPSRPASRSPMNEWGWAA